MARNSTEKSLEDIARTLERILQELRVANRVSNTGPK